MIKAIDSCSSCYKNPAVYTSNPQNLSGGFVTEVSSQPTVQTCQPQLNGEPFSAEKRIMKPRRKGLKECLSKIVKFELGCAAMTGIVQIGTVAFKLIRR